MISDSNPQPRWFDQRLRARDARMLCVHPLPCELGAEGEAGRLDVMVDQGGEEFVDRQDLWGDPGSGGDLRLGGPQGIVQNGCGVDLLADGSGRAVVQVIELEDFFHC